MKVFNHRSNLLSYLKEIPSSTNTGLVPTMGNLHDGHLALLKKSLSINEISFVSIFVNPLQFSASEDLSKYPRTLEEDLKKVEAMEKKHTNKEVIVFAPKDSKEIFGSSYGTTIRNSLLGSIIEGVDRPEHFEGVLTVVYRLFRIFKPKNAYFGKKDYQQLFLIKAMTQDLLLNVFIDSIEIQRDADGLALSSRNQYLSNEERKKALTLPKTLKKLASKIGQCAETNQELIEAVKDKDWRYLEIKDTQNLQDISKKTKEVVLLAVYKVGNTRLLDNIEVNIEKS